jgi:hypothetical protein
MVLNIVCYTVDTPVVSKSNPEKYTGDDAVLPNEPVWNTTGGTFDSSNVPTLIGLK